ncbi:MAG: aspartate dehydrogenase [Actinobacteria bacterium]|nr:aspartate dehydrogenase [Actinomycetota bacterium]
MSARSPTRVGLIGHGAIGGAVARMLEAGRVRDCVLAGVLVRQADADTTPALVDDVEELCGRCDLVVEAAGHAALAAHGPAVVAAGVELLVVSTGALASDELHRRLIEAGPGRVLISTGAIGGLDTLRAAHLLGALETVQLHTTKPTRVLREPWMDARLLEQLDDGTEPVTVFTGSAREAATRFPRSINIGATLALATLGFDDTDVAITADPAADRVEHVISAEGPAGEYEFRFRNRPSATNPRTSAITPYAVLRALADRTARVVVGV